MEPAGSCVPPSVSREADSFPEITMAVPFTVENRYAKAGEQKGTLPADGRYFLFPNQNIVDSDF